MDRLLDPSLMKTFLAVAEEPNYTAVGDRLGLTQQAISAQMKRLEAAVGRQLVERARYGVALTADGAVLLAYAKQLAEISDKVYRHFAAVSITGSIRVGVPEGFASVGLPGVLAAVREIQPDLEIIVESGSTGVLLARMDHGQLDLMLGLQRQGETYGELLWTDQMHWFGAAQDHAAPGDPVRLVLPAEPSVQRAVAIETLAKASRPYIVLFESESRAVRRAAALAGLGVAAFCESAREDGFPPPRLNLPPLPAVEAFLRTGENHNEITDMFADVVRLSGRRLMEQRLL